MKQQKRKLKLTPWYSGVDPLKSRPGQYQCSCCHRLFYWDGLAWWDGNLDTVVLLWRGVAR